MTITSECHHCGKFFEASRPAKACSVACRNRLNLYDPCDCGCLKAKGAKYCRECYRKDRGKKP